MTEFRTRIKHKIDTTENWRANTTFIPLKGEVIIYSDYSVKEVNGLSVKIPGVKIGDGTTYAVDLPFVSDDIRDMLINHINNNVVHVTQAERDFWNNKVRCYLELEDDGGGFTIESENLIFTTT